MLQQAEPLLVPCRGVDSQPSRFDVSLLDASASAEAAAGVAQCKVCMALASLLWQGLTSWVNIHEAVPAKKRIADYAEQLCELEVRASLALDSLRARRRGPGLVSALWFVEQAGGWVGSTLALQAGAPQACAAVPARNFSSGTSWLSCAARRRPTMCSPSGWCCGPRCSPTRRRPFSWRGIRWE